MNPLKFLKGGIDVGKTTDNLLDKLDDSKFTEEEKSEAKMKVIEYYTEWYKMSLDESTVRSKSRRTIAYIIISNVFAFAWLGAILKLMGKDISFIFELSDAFQFGLAFVSVIAFFFGAHILRSAKKKPTEK